MKEESTYSFVRSRRAKTYIPDHSHPKYEFVYFFSGKGIVKYQGKSMPFSAGTYYIMESGVIHSELYENTGISLVVQFMPPDENLHVPSLVFHDCKLNLNPICAQMREELKNRYYGYETVVDGLMRETLALVARMLHIKKGDSRGGVKDAVLYIDQYFMTDIQVDELAANSGYSPDHFRYLFRLQTGTSPKKYILNKRIRLAKTLLKESGLSISEIGLRCGFESYSQFMTFFRNRTGYPPGEYRKNLQHLK